MSTENEPLGGDSANRYALRRPITLLVALVYAAVSSFPQLFLALYLVPILTAGYRDLLGDRPLPAATTIALQLQWPCVAFAFLWGLGTMLVIRRRGSTHHMFPLLLVPTFPILLTTAGLILPLIPVVTGK